MGDNVEEKPLTMDVKEEPPSFTASEHQVDGDQPTPSESVPPTVDDRPRLFEQFLVVGIDDSVIYKEKANVSIAAPPTTQRKLLPFFNTVYEPKVLYRYPNVERPNAIKVESFCFPSGVKTSRIKRSDSMGALNEIYFSQNYMFDTNHSYIFRLTNEGNTLYGICITKDELVSENPTFFPLTTTTETQDPSNDHLLVGSRCYCLISRYPFFRLHFSVLHSILDHDRLARIIEKQDISDVDHHITSGNVVSDMLQRVPEPGEEIQFQLSGEMKSKRFQCPVVDVENSCIAEWTMVPTIKVLPLDHLLLLFNAILLERPIIVKCRRSLGTLSNLVLSCIPLLRPLEWTGLLISLLPNSLNDVLQGTSTVYNSPDLFLAPVPFIVGVNHLSAEVDTLIVDLDNNKIINQDFSMPMLPEWKKLSHNLKVDYDKIHTAPEYFNSVLTPSILHREAASAVLESLQKYVSWLLSKVRGHFSQRAVSDLQLDLTNVRMREEVAEDFVASVSPVNRKFMEILLATQHFSVYSSVHLSDSSKLVAEATPPPATKTMTT
ncbi:hypothetical protein PROFUN_04918 [Planoprotostelium fungivorum]|uniref:UDENN domain-containing protein n=1 Tax=Planoprotostelium fungivorum TaxID=1890364 RepID=A0A2P6NF78_9EUKA|nr:hypothetical protein PROFUN_04918 [Planoprotostelium fungivorum]